MTAPFVREISVDYSDDELDAIATAFSRTDLARAPERAGDDPVRRAQRQTALRGLVARRAIMLSGTSARPQIAFLEPHATLLGTWLRAPLVVTLRSEERDLARSVSILARDEVVVHVGGLPGQAIQRLTAHGRDGAAALLAAELNLDTAIGPAEGAAPVEVTARMVNATLAAQQRRETPPECVPEAAARILHARRSSASLTLTTRAPGVQSAERWSWIDAGEVGLWRVRGGGSAPTLTLEPAQPSALRGEIAAAWAAALAPAAG